MRLAPLVLACSLCGVCSARGEVFLLTNDGKIQGELLNKDEKPREKYVIRTATGAQVVLLESQVKKVLAQSPAEIEYEKIKSRYADTVAAQWELAEWCQEQRLNKSRQVHLERVVQLDPNHVEARRALGYIKLDGQWKTQEQAMTDRGYVRYKGDWVLPQKVELLEQARKVDLAEKEWFRKLKQWRDWLDRPEKKQAAWELIAQINDPHAVKAIEQALTKDVKEQEKLRKLFLEVLDTIGTPEAVGVLATIAIEDPVEEIRLSALDRLQKKPNPDVVRRFIKGLSSKDNVTVNRAGLALKKMSDPLAIPALIDSLVTKHRYRISQGQPAGSTSATFNTTPGASGGAFGGGSFGSGPGGMSFGQGPRFKDVLEKNRDVLDALVLITGVNFDYDAKAWKNWLATQQKKPGADTRRG